MQYKKWDRAAAEDYLLSVGVNIELLKEANLSDLEIAAFAVGIRGLFEKASPIQHQDLS